MKVDIKQRQKDTTLGIIPILFPNVYLHSMKYLLLLLLCSCHDTTTTPEKEQFITLRWTIHAEKPNVSIRSVRATWRMNDGTDQGKQLWEGNSPDASGTGQWVKGNMGWLSLTATADTRVFMEIFNDTALFTSGHIFTEDGSSVPGSHGSMHFTVPDSL